MTDTPDNDPIIGWISFEYSGGINVYASDPIADRIASMSSAELQEHFGRDSIEAIDHWTFDWQPQ